MSTIFWTIIEIFRSGIAIVLAFFGIANPWGTTQTNTIEVLYPQGEVLQLDGYELIFEDHFDGNTVDTAKWKPTVGGFGCGCRDTSQLSVHDSNLYITGEYLKNGAYGAGWYCGELNTVEKYCKGYYEIRCKVNADSNNIAGFWSAFWLTSEGDEYNADISKGGIGGCEIDIMEAMQGNNTDEKIKNTCVSTLWCNGSDENDDELDGKSLGYFYVGDMVNEYNTYGVMWTDTEYIFYINGVESGRSSFADGVSCVPETLRVTLNISQNQPSNNKNYKTVFTVDYVRIYQPVQ